MAKRTATEADIGSARTDKPVAAASRDLPAGVIATLAALREKEPLLEIIEINEGGGYQRFLVPIRNLDGDLLTYMLTLSRSSSTPAHPSEYYDDEPEGSDKRRQARALCTLMGTYLRSLPDEEQEDWAPGFKSAVDEPLPPDYVVRTSADLQKFCAQAVATPVYGEHNIIATLLFSDYC